MDTWSDPRQSVIVGPTGMNHPVLISLSIEIKIQRVGLSMMMTPDGVIMEMSGSSEPSAESGGENGTPPAPDSLATMLKKEFPKT